MKSLFLIFIFLFLSVNLFAAAIEYQADYLWTIAELTFPVKDLKVYLLDTRQGIAEPFGSYITTNDLTVKPYGLAAIRISTGTVLKMFFFEDLAGLKTKVVNYCQTQGINLSWKAKSGKINNWWMKTEY